MASRLKPKPKSQKTPAESVVECTSSINDDLRAAYIEECEGLVAALKTMLKSHDFFIYWIDNFESFKKDSKTIYDIMTNRFLEMAKQEDESELKYSALEVIGRKLTQVFMAVYLRKMAIIDEYIKEASALIHHCCDAAVNYIPDDYLPGLMYCLQSIEAYFLTLQVSGSRNKIRLDKMLKTLVPLEQLSMRGQVGVLAIRQSFVGHIDRKSYTEQLELLKRMIRLDPIGEWYHWQHNVFRFKRKHSWNFAPPGSEEISAIVKAAELAPQNPRILVAFFASLAELVRKLGADWTGEEDFGCGLVFRSSVEIVQFIKTESRKLLVLDPMSVKVNITVAEIFSTSLPYRFLDFVFAKMCIERALLFHPNSSKANGRMGIFLLNNYDNRFEATEYFVNALRADPRNFPTLMDLLLTYISDHYVNRTKIEAVLNEQLVNTDWNNQNLSRLYFIKGIHLYMMCRNREALNCWILTFKFCGDITIFKSFANFKRKYGWRDLNLENIYRMTRSEKWNFDDNDTLILEEVIQTIKRGMHKEKKLDADMGIRQGYANRYQGLVSYDGPRRVNDEIRPGALWLRRSSTAPRNVNTTFPAPVNNCDQLCESKPQEIPSRITKDDASTIIGVTPGASLDEIKIQYRKLCFAVHPDRNPHLSKKEAEENLEKMKSINVAYEELTSKWSQESLRLPEPEYDVDDEDATELLDSLI